MVLLHVKQKDERQFLFEAAGTDSVDLVIKELVVVNNLQVRISSLKELGKQLALHGPSRNPDDDDDSDEDEKSQKKKKKARGPFYNRDPTSQRTGEACNPEVSNVITKAVDDAITMVSKEQVLQKVVLTASMLKEAIQTIRGGVMICYPQGLPSYDPVQQAITGTASLKELLDPDTAHLWWAGKELMRDKCLRDIVGKNEKTKVIVKLQDKGQGCPAREPQLAQDEDDACMNARWANPKSLKSHLHGMASNMKFR